jgi:hypothetical protein
MPSPIMRITRGGGSRVDVSLSPVVVEVEDVVSTPDDDVVSTAEVLAVVDAVPELVLVPVDASLPSSPAGAAESPQASALARTRRTRRRTNITAEARA